MHDWKRGQLEILIPHFLDLINASSSVTSSLWESVLLSLAWSTRIQAINEARITGTKSERERKKERCEVLRTVFQNSIKISSRRLAPCWRATPGRESRVEREIWGTTCSGRSRGCAKTARPRKPFRAARAASRACRAEAALARRPWYAQEAITARYPARTGTQPARRLSARSSVVRGHWWTTLPARTIRTR